jgi:hypothetical protein
MKYQLIKILGLIFSLSLLISWSSVDNGKGVLVTISMTTTGAMQNGYGIIMTLTNTETKETFESKSLGPISPHAMFKELPAGKYVVSKIEVPLGQLKYINRSKELTDFFGLLEFEKDKAYYLGNFIGNREIGRNNVFHLWLDKPDIHPTLLKKLIKKKIELTEENLIKVFPYEQEKLTIY